MSENKLLCNFNDMIEALNGLLSFIGVIRVELKDEYYKLDQFDKYKSMV